MKRCVNCGEPLEDDDLFCPDCGAKQLEAADADGVAETEPQPATAKAQEAAAKEPAAAAHDEAAKDGAAAKDDSDVFPAAPVEIPLTDALKEALAGDVKEVGLLNGKTPVVCYEGTKKGKLLAVQGTFVVVGDEVRGPYEEVEDLSFSSTGEWLVYKAKVEGKDYIVMNDKQYGPCYGINEDGILSLFYLLNSGYVWTFSKDGSTAACAVHLDNGWHVYQGGKEYKANGACLPPELSPNGKNVAYCAKVGDEWQLY